MNCPDDVKLMAFMDGELDPAQREQMADHVSLCERCSSVLASQGLLEKSWRDSWRDPPDLRFQVMRKSLLRKTRERRGAPGWLIGIAAGAVAVFLGVKVFVLPGRTVLEDRIQAETVFRSQGAEPDDFSVTLEQAADSEEETSADSPVAATETPVEDQWQTSSATTPAPEEAAPEQVSGQMTQAHAESEEFAQGIECVVVYQSSAQEGQAALARAVNDTDAVAGEAQPASEQSAVPSGAGLYGGSGGGGLAVSGTRFAEVGVASAPAWSPGFSLICEGPDGTSVEPWDRLNSFVDSILTATGAIPGLFLVDSLGYAVEFGAIPRAFLGVTDPARVPLTVRVIVH